MDDRDENGPDGEEADAPAGEQEPTEPSWFETAATMTCPACGAEGAMALGEGIFCPTCGEVSTPRSPTG